MLVSPHKNARRPVKHQQTIFDPAKFRRMFSLFAGATIVVLVLAFILKGQIKSEFHQWTKSKGFGYVQHDIRLREALFDAPLNFVRAKEVPKLVLDVKFKHMQKIFKKRAEALKKNLLVQGKNDFVPASIRVRGIEEKINAKIRLKGDFVDHLKGDKWSFRVHTKGKDHFSGLRRFSVQHPKTRGFQQEPLFFEILAQLDILAPRYSFVDLSVNGKNIGLMAVEEHFSKELLEANGRKEGVIVRFDESIVFDARDGFERRMGLDGGVFDSYKNTYIDAFRSSKVKKSERLSRDYGNAVGMLRGFVSGEMKASDVFDATQIGKLAAAADLWGAWHVLEWRNIRFYLNPITMKLEPIAYDANHDDRGKVNTLVSRKSQLFSELLKDPVIFNAYKDAILSLANNINRGNLLETLKAKEEGILHQLQNEYFLLPGIDYEYFSRQATFISTYDFSQYTAREYHFTDNIKLDDIRAIDYPRILHAYLIDGKKGISDNTFRLELASAVPYDINITNIQLKAKKSKTPRLKTPKNTAYTLPLMLPVLQKGDTPVFSVTLEVDGFDVKKYDLEVSAKIAGREQTYTLKAMPYYPSIATKFLPTSTLEDQLVKHRFLSVDEAHKTLSVSKGVHKITQSLIIPSGYTLKINKGTTLQFSNNAILMSYGPVKMVGSLQEPIILEPFPGANAGAETGREIPNWQGIVVMQAGATSQLTHVEFRKTKGIVQGGWQLTGGVTFYESNIEINNASFIDNSGEDALNVIHSSFDITDIYIERSASDAFDSDFSDGQFTKGIFKDIGLAGGGDGIDISGSNVVVTGTQFINIDDKALSVGEKSAMVAKNIDINGAGTGAASKDGSTLTISDSHFANISTVGLMAYIKKPEYGGAKISGTNLTFKPPVKSARVQKGNQIILDGEMVETEDINVKEMYKTIMKPGLR